MIYFDNGATTFPKPQTVVRAVCNTTRFLGANPGRSGHDMSMRASQIIYECRKNAAEFFGAENPENVVFTPNCTFALNTVIKGVLKKGDHAVISSLEHNAVARPLEYLKRYGIGYSVADVVCGDDERTLNNFRNALRNNTKLVFCTGASNVFGVRLPIGRIAAMCKIYGILFCLDAAQTAGVVPVSVKEDGIDYLCAAGHKGLYGPMGTGILVVNSQTVPDGLVQGGTGSMSADLDQPSALPDRLESGTPNLAGIAGLNEGIRFVQKRGEERLFKKEIALIQRLYDGLSNIDGVELYTDRPAIQTHVPVLSFNIKGHDSEEIAALLNDRFNIAVRAGLHCAPLAHESFGTLQRGTVRAVVSVFTETVQVDYFVASVYKIIKLLPKKVAIDNQNVLE